MDLEAGCDVFAAVVFDMWPFALLDLEHEMTTLREVAQQALEFVTSEQWGTVPYMRGDVYSDAQELEDALRDALAEPVQEPVAWFHTDFGSLELSRVQRVGWKPLYTAPPQRKPLTDDEVKQVLKVGSVYTPDGVVTRIALSAFRKAEEAHGIKEAK